MKENKNDSVNLFEELDYNAENMLAIRGIKLFYI
jgi:hypothetical protein